MPSQAKTKDRCALCYSRAARPGAIFSSKPSIRRFRNTALKFVPHKSPKSVWLFAKGIPVPLVAGLDALQVGAAL